MLGVANVTPPQCQVDSEARPSSQNTVCEHFLRAEREHPALFRSHSQNQGNKTQLRQAQISQVWQAWNLHRECKSESGSFTLFLL